MKKDLGELQHSLLSMILEKKSLTVGQALYRLDLFHVYKAKSIAIDIKG